MIFIATIAGGVLYRWRGHSSKYKKFFPRPFNQIAFALPYAYVAYLSCGYIIAGFVLIVTTLGVLTGHGRGFNNDTLQGEPETTEYLILWLRPYIPLNLYKFLVMSITGLAITLWTGIATLNPLLAVSGILKGIAYFITRDTRVAEFFTGMALWGSLTILF